jgi:hypothetical protein
MRTSLPCGLLVVLALAATGTAAGQSAPNLSGTWVLQADQSSFGMMPAPQSRTDVIDHQEPKLTIKRTTTNANGETTTSELTYAVDGQPYKNMAGPTEITSRLHWDGKVLVSVSTATAPQGEVTITDRYTLSEDGKTLTQQRSLSVAGQEIAQTMVLAKQP